VCSTFLLHPRVLVAALISLLAGVAPAADVGPFEFPTANRALFESGGDERFFVGTTGQPWTSGTFGCVRSEGWRFHEGLDIRCLQRDQRGEPSDPVLAAADGTVAYINKRPTLSNSGNYVVLRHRVEGMDIYTLYAHLSAIQPGLKAGVAIRRGDRLGTMGRTTDTREPITPDRAHVHFEMDLLINPRFATWQKRNKPKERNDHGNWNGHNLAGFDPRAVLLAQRVQGVKFSLASLLRSQPELCRVFVRSRSFPFLKSAAPLILPNPRAAKEGIVGYELALTFNGLPVRITPRAASEVSSRERIQLLAVNESEARRNPACRLVTQKTGSWELTDTGRSRIELLIY
jgi:murein DD-endopeptidase MepM/ murein hydrolase activator NlpD